MFHELQHLGRQEAEVLRDEVDVRIGGLDRVDKRASIVIMLAAFVAVCVFRVNVVYIILVCIGLGVLRTLLARRKKA